MSSFQPTGAGWNEPQTLSSVLLDRSHQSMIGDQGGPDVLLNNFLLRLFPAINNVNSRIVLLSNLSDHISSQLQEIEAEAVGLLENGDARQNEGRFGPAVVKLDKASVTQGSRCRLSEDGLSFEAHSNFVSVRANTCVSKGRWIFEVTVGTAGIQQLGWAPLSCEFNDLRGVGDSRHSFAYDGKRKSLWNVGRASYGDEWVPGDIIGCALDVDVGEIEYFRNGKSMGIACKNVAKGPGYAYFPTISLSYAERCCVNFGAKSLRYSGIKFQSIQAPPPSYKKARIDYLIAALRRLLLLDMDSIPEVLRCSKLFIKTICSAHVVELLWPCLCDAQVMTDQVIPLLIELLNMDDGNKYIDRWNSLILALLDETQIVELVQSLFAQISFNCQSKFLWEGGVDQVRLAAAILFQSREIFSIWLHLPNSVFDRQIEGLLSVKLAILGDRDDVIPVVHWDSNEQSHESKQQFRERIHTLRNFFSDTDNAHNTIITLMLDTTELPDYITRSPYSFFKAWMKRFLKANVPLQRHQVPPGTCDHTVLTSLQGALMQSFTKAVLQENESQENESQLIADEMLSNCIHDRVFVDDAIDMSEFSRVGGLLSHVKNELQKKEDSGEIESEDGKRLDDSEICTTPFRLLAYSVMVYDLALILPYQRLQQAYKEVTRAIKTEAEGRARLERARSQLENGILDNVENNGLNPIFLLEKADEVFRNHARESIQTVVLLEVGYLGGARRSSLVKYLDAVCSLLIRWHSHKDYFSFVPEAFIHVVINSFGTLGSDSANVVGTFGEDSINPLFLTCPSYEGVLLKYVSLLAKLASDKRIITPDLSWGILMAIKSVTGVVPYIRRLEEDRQLCKELVLSLLGSYEGRLWVQVTDILVRFWAGTGFAYDACITSLSSDEVVDEECASEVCQEEFGKICKESPEVAEKFLNELINHVNWTASEFDTSLEEIRNANEEMTQDASEYYQKCILYFEVTVNLLRLLEGTARYGSVLFFGGEKSLMNLERVVQLLVHMIDRTSSNPLYDSVTATHGGSLSSLRKELLLSPIYGTFMTLIDLCPMEENFADNKVVKIAVEGGRLKSDLLVSDSILQLDEIGPHETAVLEIFISSLKPVLRAQEKEPKEVESDQGDDDGICTICYAYPIDATFHPCQHRSCSKCIQRHLLNEQKCFFCNAVVEKVVVDKENGETEI